MSNFQQFEIVGRGSETQLQGGEHLSKIGLRTNIQSTLYSLNLYTFEGVSRCRDPQLQVGKDYLNL